VKRRFASLLVAISCAGFGAALALPLFTIHPAAGKWTALAKLLTPENFQEKSITLPDGIISLWNGGEWHLAVLIGALSLLLPMIKLAVLWWEICGDLKIQPALLGFFRSAARYAMAEVFLIALLIMWVKGMPGGSGISLQAGTWCFTGSVLLSFVASRLMETGAAADSIENRHQP
jgi:paraquat-inducible protein A